MPALNSSRKQFIFSCKGRKVSCFIKNAKVNSPIKGWEENPCLEIINKVLTQQLCTNGEPGSTTGLVHLGKSPQDR